MLILDGSQGEGGGQMVRTALALSTLTQIPFEMKNIRKNRPEPGLKTQHLQSIELLKQCTGAKTNPIELKSDHLIFYPGPINKGKYTVDIGTAGSITLLLQSILLPSLFAPGKITFNITGGTCGKFQASTTYLDKILLPQLQRFAKIECKTVKRGYFPTGGGQIEISITPKISSNKYSTTEGLLTHIATNIPLYNIKKFTFPSIIKCYINLARELEEKDVALRIKRSIEQTLRPSSIPISTNIEYVTTSSIGGEVVLAAYISTSPENLIIIGSDIIIEKNISSEELGKQVAMKLLNSINSETCLDPYLTDQLLSFASLLPGSTLLSEKITSHTLSNQEIITQFLPVKIQSSLPPKAASKTSTLLTITKI